jgi:membrane-bound lytic murein transglycosylase D
MLAVVSSALAIAWSSASGAQPAAGAQKGEKTAPAPPSKAPEQAPKAKPVPKVDKADAPAPSPPVPPAPPADKAIDSTSAAGPRAGSGTRSIEPPAPQPSPRQSEAQPSTTDVKGAAAQGALKGPRAHQKGRPPKTPSPTLPAGAPRALADMKGRREVSAGLTADDVRAGTDDPELRALREAERALFPKPLRGAQAGWSWELPQAPDKALPEVIASGTPPSARLDVPEPDPTAPQTAEWLRTLTLPNVPVRLDAHVVKYLEFYRDSAKGRSIARVWAKKSGKYVGALRAELAKAGLPTDLVWLSLIESGHNPIIVSPAGAAGLWQLMPDAGRLYGLTVDRWVDERFDPQRSTEAAVRHLSDLYRRFGSWELAMAAYNMGYAGLVKAIRKFNTNDFWELCHYEAGIPWETTLYVPKIFALAVVMNNKRAFGLTDVVPDPPASFDTVLVSSAVTLESVAAAADTPLAAVEQLNRHYLAGRTPPLRPGDQKTTYAIRVPPGKGAAATEKLSKTSEPDAGIEPYVVRFGDTVDSIASARKTSENRIRSLNRIASGEALSAGTVLLVPRGAGAAPAESAVSAVSAPDAAADAENGGADSADVVVVVPPRQFAYPDRQRIFYRVLSGDSLGGIALAFGVTRAELVAWNSIDQNARLQGGMVLQLFVTKNRLLSHVRYTKETDARVLVAGTPEFFDYFEGLRGRKRIKVVAREGDSLRTIGNRYGMSIGWMERINRRSRTDKLEAGDAVIVYVDRRVPNTTTASATVAAAPLSDVAAPRPDALPALPGAAGAPAQGTTAGP